MGRMGMPGLVPLAAPDSGPDRSADFVADDDAAFHSTPHRCPCHTRSNKSADRDRCPRQHPTDRRADPDPVCDPDHRVANLAAYSYGLAGGTNQYGTNCSAHTCPNPTSDPSADGYCIA